MIDIFIRNHSFSVFCDRQKLFDANILKFRRFLLTLQQVKSNGPVAQLNRASDSGSECRGFESHRGHAFALRRSKEQRSALLVFIPSDGIYVGSGPGFCFTFRLSVFKNC